MKQETTHRRLVVGMSSVFSRGQASTTDYKEIKTFDIYIKNGETYLNAKNATIKGQGYISFDTEDGRHLETNAEAVVEVHTEIIKE